MATPRYVNIVDNDTLVRDTFSMGVINVNPHALFEAKKRHSAAMVNLAEERRKVSELNNLRTEVAELKSLVLQLLEKK